MASESDAPAWGFCPRCDASRPLELDWSCCGCGWETRTPYIRKATAPTWRRIVDALTGGS